MVDRQNGRILVVPEKGVCKSFHWTQKHTHWCFISCTSLCIPSAVDSLCKQSDHNRSDMVPRILKCVDISTHNGPQAVLLKVLRASKEIPNCVMPNHEWDLLFTNLLIRETLCLKMGLVLKDVCMSRFRL